MGQLPEKSASVEGHKQLWEFDISDAPFVGKRGGVKTPQYVEWRTEGTGFLRSVWRKCGCTVLVPHVTSILQNGGSLRVKGPGVDIRVRGDRR